MNEAAAERKRKLQEIRERSKKSKTQSSSEVDPDGKGENKIKFRNYTPRDAALVNAIVKKDDEENTSDNTDAAIGDSDIIKHELRQLGEEEELNILPKNNNWDLKKQLEPKMEKLRRRTQRAIVDILRQKIADEDDSESEDDIDM